MKKIMILFVVLEILGCRSSEIKYPDKIKPVANFELKKYLGKWYEIARFQHFFEKDLEFVSATYTMLPKGKIEVLNEGIKKDGSKKSIKGKAFLANKKTPSLLKVSFFWFFSSNYIVFELDQENYSYAMVTSSTKDYFWILSRNKKMDDSIYKKLIEKAEKLSFDTSKIYKVKQF